MVNRNNAHRRAKRRRNKPSAAVQNQAPPRKTVIILDDAWLEALKHLTCPQWSKMSLVCRQVNGIVQRNISRLPRQLIESIDLNPKPVKLFDPPSYIKQYLSLSRRFNPRFTDIASYRSTFIAGSEESQVLQKLFHPASYIEKAAMHPVKQKLIDASCNSEKRYIHCQSFELLPYSDESSTPRKIAQSLDWLVRNVRSDSISFPKSMFNEIVNNAKIRAVLTNFIFGASRKCKARELVFSFDELVCYHSDSDHLSSVGFVDTLIKGFVALPVVQGIIPRVVIDRYPGEEVYRADLGKNLIGEVDLEGYLEKYAEAFYVIKKEEKRVGISFYRPDSYGPYAARMTFDTIQKT